VEHGEHHGCLKDKEISHGLVITPIRAFSPLTMKVSSFFFALGLGVLALAHSGHETRTNVKDISAQSSWDSTIGKGVPALVELYVP
jgi:hypothetical protein